MANRERDSAVFGPLGSLALSVVRTGAPGLALRAVKWHRDLAKLGVIVPLVVVHDLGLLFAAPREQVVIGPRIDVRELEAADGEIVPTQKRYESIVAELAEAEVTRRASTMRLGDDLIVVVLGRMLGPVAARQKSAPPYRAEVPLDPSLLELSHAEIVAKYRSVPRQYELAFLDAIDKARLLLSVLADSIDLDTLRLFGMLGAEAPLGALAQVDLLAALSSPEANDVVGFSLEILPSILETKTRGSAGTDVALGYAGIGRHGSIDNLVLTELAWDDDELARRFAEREVLFYAREQSQERTKRLHHLLIDASASMRGDRHVFARGMALATAKKLLLAGDDVTLRFFDARLYEMQRARAGHVPTAYILSFQGERGRNPSRVFSALSVEIELLRSRDRAEHVVHIFTHAALYIPRATVAELKRHARLTAVFILPSEGELNLDYLDLLDASWIVDHRTLIERSARAARAKTILGDVERRSLRPT